MNNQFRTNMPSVSTRAILSLSKRPVLLTLIGSAMTLATAVASASIVISEVDPAGSASGSGYSEDWFELTNTGSSAVTISGWKMDDSADSFAAATALSIAGGASSIAAGQSIVFLEGSYSATADANFIAQWFASGGAPATLTLGNYGAHGLSQSGDAVNIYNSSGALITNVTFGASSLTSGTFDNTAGLSGAIATYSSVGVNGAFTSGKGEIGSPGIDTAVAPVPLPASAWLLLASVGILTPFSRRKSAPGKRPA
jgi:hypothetical protein